jgi:hypothetical protein
MFLVTHNWYECVTAIRVPVTVFTPMFKGCVVLST